MMPRSLQKKDENGNTYVRPAATEKTIVAATAQNLATLVRRASISDKESADYLPSECLVYLVRDAWRRRADDPTYNATMSKFLQFLLKRCHDRLKSKLGRYKLTDEETVREEILGDFSELFAEDGTGENPDQLDYFECRFNSAFFTFYHDTARREWTRLNHTASLPISDELEDTSTDDEVLTRLSATFQERVSKQQDLILKDAYMEDLLTAIDCLPPDERKAVVLCHILQYKEESDDPSKRTAATICHVSGRTIRNRLKRAAAMLSQFNQEV
jgi:DNA-directed RNA polymerase specialized sigma24 family protein